MHACKYTDTKADSRRYAARASAFTLVELMVAVAIIALLISIMIPGFSAVRERARIVDTQSIFKGIDSGLEAYRGEQALGGVYPPSRSDSTETGYFKLADPFMESKVEVRITGANLLVYALAGADRLGTPGFRDLSDPPDGWWNDQGAFENGAYEIDDTTDADNPRPVVSRYPGDGGTFVDENTQDRIEPIGTLLDEGMIRDPRNLLREQEGRQLTFNDSWGQPILYYRANRAGRVMVHDPGEAIGVYDQRDNALYTGTSLFSNADGISFGPGTVEGTDYFSRLAITNTPGLNPERDPIDPNTFEAFIHDQSVTAQNRPVNPKTYLLISAGKDAVYGTTDDVTNWARED